MRRNKGLLRKSCWCYVFVIVSSFAIVKADIFSYIKVKKLLTAYAVAKAISQRKPTTVIPVPIPIPIPIQSNEIIRIPSHSASKAYVTSLGGQSGGSAYGLESLTKGSSVYAIPGMKSGGGSSIINLSSLSRGHIDSLSGASEFDKVSFGNPMIYQSGNYLQRDRGYPNFAYRGIEDYTDGYDMDFHSNVYSSTPYQMHRKRRRRRPYPHGRRIRSQQYKNDFPDDREQWKKPMNYRSSRPRKSSHHGRDHYTRSHRPYSKSHYKSEGGPIPVGEVYG